jgi:CheY-like chemotaxis protein
MAMPNMDGLTTIRMLKKLNPALKIIAASGLSSAGQLTDINELGVETFLPKPFTAEKLLTAVAKVLGKN